MADALARGIIEVIVDGTKVASGLAQAQAAVANFAKSTQASGAASGAALAGVGTAATKAAKATQSAADKVEARLQRQAETAGKLRSEIARLDGARTGADQRPSFQANLAALEQFERSQASAIKSSDRLRNSIFKQAEANGRLKSELFQLKAVREGIDKDPGIQAAIAQMQRYEQSTSSSARASQRFIDGLQRQAQAATLLKSEMAQLNATRLGVQNNPAVVASIAKLKEAEKVTVNYGLSAKQTAQAMRLLPAQFTDIATSIASGMPLWLIAVQQGGQIKDSFGGVGNALKQIATLFTPVKVAFGLLSTILGVFAYGMFAGKKETDDFNKALNLTNNFAGTTAVGLSDMARRISDFGGTQSAASKALNEFAITGRFTATQMEALGRAAVAMNRATGKAVADTVKELVALEDGPTKAILALDKQYHFLTVSVYDQISALEQQGRVQDAARLAQDEYGRAVEQMAGKVTSQLGTIERAWKAVKDATFNSIDAIKNVGRPDTIQAQKTRAELTVAQPKFDIFRNPDADKGLSRAELVEKYGVRSTGGVNVLNKPRREEYDRAVEELRIITEQAQEIDRIVNLEKGRKADQTESIRRREAELKFLEQYGDKELKFQKELIRLKNELGRSLTPEEEANVKEKIVGKPPKAAKPPAVRDSEGDKILERLREEEAVIDRQIEGREKLTGAAAELEKFEARIAILQKEKEKSALTEGDKSVLALKDKIKAQLDINVEKEKEAAILETIKKAELDQGKRDTDRIKRLKEFNAQLDANRQSTQDQREREFTGQKEGLSDTAIKKILEERAVYKERDRERRDAAKRSNELSEAEYAEELAIIDKFFEQSLSDLRDYQEKREELRSGDIGFKKSVANFIDESTNDAKNYEKLWTTTFNSMGDAVAEFTKSGKNDFGSLIDSFIADLARIQTNQLLTKLLGYAFGAGDPTTAAVAGFAGAAGGRGSDVFQPRALGGHVFKGQSYMVGERGPERFTPGASGNIAPAGQVSQPITQHISIGQGADQAMILEAINKGNEQAMAKMQSMYRRGQGVYAS